jgi:uncharacterized surface protein with fasciclin (FAS1) repeats
VTPLGQIVDSGSPSRSRRRKYRDHNEAFAKLPKGTVEMLLLPENKDKLVAILTYHVVAGDVSAAQVVELTEVTTVQGGTASISVTDAGVTIDGAKVIVTDLDASNGVVHVIDTVIIPS